MKKLTTLLLATLLSCSKSPKSINELAQDHFKHVSVFSTLHKGTSVFQRQHPEHAAVYESCASFTTTCLIHSLTGNLLAITDKDENGWNIKEVLSEHDTNIYHYRGATPATAKHHFTVQFRLYTDSYRMYRDLHPLYVVKNNDLLLEEQYDIQQKASKPVGEYLLVNRENVNCTMVKGCETKMEFGQYIKQRKEGPLDLSNSLKVVHREGQLVAYIGEFKLDDSVERTAFTKFVPEKVAKIDYKKYLE